ncbi:hypothetical protein NC652_008017 [Populus alba x Populus x berolinensis]|nr:hypothetical protein NC652_008017 [Populus alba x Populus x berolinensis]
MAIAIKSKYQFLVASLLLVIKIESKTRASSSRVCQIVHATPQSALEVGVEIITWMTPRGKEKQPRCNA